MCQSTVDRQHRVHDVFKIDNWFKVLILLVSSTELLPQKCLEGCGDRENMTQMRLSNEVQR